MADDEESTQSAVPGWENPETSNTAIERNSAGLFTRSVTRPSDARLQDVVFVPDAFQSSEKTWRIANGELSPDIDSARHSLCVHTFDYNMNHARSIEALLSYDTIRMIALRLFRALQIKRQEYGPSFTPILVAHGYGGLISEQAYLLSLQAPRWEGLISIDGLVLFGTPHFQAGLAEWAVISATKQRIACSNSAAEQDWSTVQEDLAGIAQMQKDFRDVDSYPRIICYFALLPWSETKMKISPLWAVLPGVRCEALNKHHFNMCEAETYPDGRSLHLGNLLNGKLPHRISSLEKSKRLWVKQPVVTLEASLGDEQQSSCESEMEAITRDGIFSQGLSRYAYDQLRRYSSYGAYNRDSDIMQMIKERIDDTVTRNIGALHECLINKDHQEARSLEIIDIPRGSRIHGLDFLNAEPTESGLDLLLCGVVSEDASRNAVELLQALFIWYGPRIQVNHQLLKEAARNTSCGEDILNLLLLLRGDEIEITEDVIITVLRDNGNWKAVLKALLYWSGGTLPFREKIVKAAFTANGDVNPVLDTLDKWYGENILINAEIFEAAAKGLEERNGTANLESLFRRYGSQVDMKWVEPVAPRVASSKEHGLAAITMLLNHYKEAVLVDDVAIAAATLSPIEIRAKMALVLLQEVQGHYEDYAHFTQLLLDTTTNDIQRHSSIWELLFWAGENHNEHLGIFYELGQKSIEKKHRDLFLFDKALGHPGFISLLIEMGYINSSTVNRSNPTNQTALSRAAELGLEGPVEGLLGIKGIQVDSTDIYRRTALHWAARCGHKTIVELLITIGRARLDLEDRDGYTALAMAKGDEIKALLIAAARSSRMS